MSLLGNRGRFSSDKNKLNIDFDLNEKSELSSIGKNPISFVKNREETSTNDNDLKSRLLNTFAKRRIEDDSLHKKYNDTLKMILSTLMMRLIIIRQVLGKSQNSK